MWSDKVFFFAKIIDSMWVLRVKRSGCFRIHLITTVSRRYIHYYYVEFGVQCNIEITHIITYKKQCDSDADLTKVSVLRGRFWTVKKYRFCAQPTTADRLYMPKLMHTVKIYYWAEYILCTPIIGNNHQQKRKTACNNNNYILYTNILMAENNLNNWFNIIYFTPHSKIQYNIISFVISLLIKYFVQRMFVNNIVYHRPNLYAYV